MGFKKYFGFGMNTVSKEVYARANLSVLAVMVIMRFLMLPYLSDALIPTVFIIVTTGAIGIFALIVIFTSTEKRVLDAKLKPNFKYLILVPYVNIVFFFYLCFKK